MAKLCSAALAQVWRERVERQPGSGLGIEAFCRQEGVSPASFYEWKKRLRRPAAGKPPAAFAAVTIVGNPPSAERIEIELPQGIVLRLPPGVELRAALAAVLQAVSAGEG